jgi:TonB family protein
MFGTRPAPVPRQEVGFPTSSAPKFEWSADTVPLSTEDDTLHLELEDIGETSRALSGDGPATPPLLSDSRLALQPATPPLREEANGDAATFSFETTEEVPLRARLEEPRSRRPIYQSPRRYWRMGLYSVIGLSLLAVLVMALMRQSQTDPTAFVVDTEAYAARLAEGDSLFELAEDVEEVGGAGQSRTYYTKALEHYLVAQSIDPQGQEIQERIDIVNAKIDQPAMRDLSEKEYLAYIADADSILRSAEGLVLQGDSVRARPMYTEARRIYMRVLEYRPEDSLANARLSATFQRQLPVRTDAQTLPAPKARAAAPVPRPLVNSEVLRNEQFYQLYRSQGDSAFDARNYRDAQRKFTEALEYRPDDEYATSMLRQIERRLADSSRDALYRQHMAAGRQLRSDNRLSDARREFELALDAKPDDYEAKSALFEVDLQLNQAQRREEEYMSFRARGDVLYEQADYAGALASYQAALEAKPDDDYVKNRVQETNANIEALRRADQQLPEGMVDANGIYNFSEEAPVLIGGIQALQSRIRYPAFARQAGVEGRVTVRMVVDENGDMVRPEIMNGLGYGIDEEVLRVLRGARFEPGRVGGKAVGVWHTLFFDFKIDDL